MAADGFLNLLKPPGMTSHDAVAWLGRLTGVTAGHVGALDRAAAGVLVLCVGKARRLTQWVVRDDKGYVAEVTFGVTTDTLDAEGAVVRECDSSHLGAPQVEHALASFVGDIEQRAPAYSAVHANGMRLYQLARAGREAPVRTRAVRVHCARLLDFSAGPHARARIAITCSKGTYIRALATDLGDALGCGGCLSFLVRTRSGAFDIADSATIEDVAGAIARHRFEGLLRPLDEPLSSLSAVTLEPCDARLAEHGSAVQAGAGLEPGALLRMYDTTGRFIGLGEVRAEALVPRMIIAR